MNRLVFGIIWTVLAGAVSVALHLQPEFSQQSLLYQGIMTVLPLAGIFAIRDSLRRIRRHKSVRREVGPAGYIYVWTDFDGTVKRETEDPRSRWKAEDRDFSD